MLILQYLLLAKIYYQLDLCLSVLAEFLLLYHLFVVQIMLTVPPPVLL